MTDNTSATPPGTVPGTPGTAAADEAVASQSCKGKGVNSTLVTALIIVILLAVGLGWAAWLQRKQFVSAGQEVAARLNTLGAELTQSRNDMREALALAQAQSGKVAELEGKVREAQSQYSALQTPRAGAGSRGARVRPVRARLAPDRRRGRHRSP